MNRLAFIILVLIIPALSHGFDQVQFTKRLGQRGAGPGQFNEPSDIAVDSEGVIYVADRGNKRVHVMSKDGRTLSTWKSRAVDVWKLEEPSGIAVYGNKVYVVDQYRNKVLIFFKNGKFVDEFGGDGKGPKQFNGPQGIIVHQGIVYVADKGNHRVQMFSLDGIYQGTIGKKGKGIGEMLRPTDVAVDHKGYIYVSEEGNNRIGVFLQSGHHYKYFYKIKKPSAVAVDGKGFFVGDAGNYKVKKFNMRSSLILSFGLKGDGKAQFRAIAGIALDNEGNILVVDSESNSIQVFSPEEKIGIKQDSVPPSDSVKWVKNIGARVADMVWHRDRLYATSSEDSALLVIDKGKVRKVIKGKGNDMLDNPHGITVDAGGNLWIADTDNDRIVNVSKDGRILSSIGQSGSKEGRFSSPKGVAVSRKGILYIADTGNERVQIINTSGVYISKIEKIGRVDFDEPVDIDIDRYGNIYVVDKGFNSVAKYDATGRFIMYVGGEGEAAGRFNEPESVTVTGNELFVLDSGNNRVQVFNLKGKYVRQFGSKGTGKGDFMNPVSITKMDHKTIFVSDYENNRIQELQLLRAPKSPKGLEAVSGAKAIKLTWKKSSEPFVGHYRVYRSEDKMNYQLAASPRQPSFSDSNIKQEVNYYYRVSAVASYGYESAKSSIASVKTKKLVALPPTSLRVAPDENAIALRWKPAEGESFVSHYLVYREVNGEFREVGKVKETKFTDKGLKPKTKYTYKVTAVSPNNEESRGISVKTETIFKVPPVQVTVLKVRDIFPRALKVYKKEGIGRIKVKNNTDKLMEDVLVSFMTKEFMDRPTVIKIGKIMPDDFVEVDVKPVTFNNRILTLKENRSLEAKFKTVFYKDNKKLAVTSSHKLMVILTGRKYTKAEIKRFEGAMSALNSRVKKYKADKTVTKKIQSELDATGASIKKLRSAQLSYGDIVVCLYISNEADKTPNDILAVKEEGQGWPDLMSIFELSISDVTTTINEIEKSIVVKKKVAPKKRQRATDRYVK